MYFLIKIILFTLKIYLFAPKFSFKAYFTTKHAKSFVKINFLVTFLHFWVWYTKNFEDNLRILPKFRKFSRKNSKIYGFRPYVFKTYSFFFLYFLIKNILFYTKNLFIRPKNCVQIIFYSEKCKKFRKNQCFSNIFTFLSVIRQNFEDNLRILANFGKFSRKKLKNLWISPIRFQKTTVFFFCIF